MLSRIALLALVALVVGSAAFAEEEGEEAVSEAAETAAEEKVCFDRRQIRNFDGLSGDHVFIEQSGKKYFLLTMRNRCIGLRHANGIGITDTMNRICSDGTGEIVFRDIGHVQRCQVGTIELVENKDAARAFFDERMQYEKNRKAKDAEKE
jgi:hypothetical protein